MFNQHLINLGLSNKESLVYLASLKLGSFTVQELSRKSGIPRTTIYNLIRSLQEKGLVSEQHRVNKRYFTAQSPDRLLSNLRVQKAEMEEKEKNLQDILPELKGMISQPKERPAVKSFEGKEGIRAMQEDIAISRGLSVMEEFVPIDQAYKLFPPHKRDHRRRLKKTLNYTKQRVIYTSNDGDFLLPQGQLVERLFLSPDQFPLSCEINIYGNKVSMVTFEDTPQGLIIEAEEVAESLRAIFYCLWRSGKSH